MHTSVGLILDYLPTCLPAYLHTFIELPMSRGLDFGAEHVRFSASDLTSKVVGLGIILIVDLSNIVGYQRLKRWNMRKKPHCCIQYFFFATEKKCKIL